MKLEIPIIVGFDDMESLLDDLKKLQTYKLSEGAEEVLVDIEDVAEVLIKHVKARESVTTDDLIRRADALSCFHDWIDQRGDVHTADEMPEYQRIEQLPTAQPKTGKWMTDNPSNPYESDYCKCSVCGYINCTVEVFSFDGYKYCPNCGAKMLKEGEEHD